MKNETLFYVLISTIVIVGAIMKIQHMMYSNLVFISGMILSISFQSYHIRYLKKKLTNKGNQNSSL